MGNGKTETDRLADQILSDLGDAENVISAVTCMTRLRVRVRQDEKVREKDLGALDEVLSIRRPVKGYLEIVLGPGKSQKCLEALRERGIPGETEQPSRAWDGEAVGEKKDRETKTGTEKGRRLRDGARRVCKNFGTIFAPLIPGIVAAGLCAGFAALIPLLVPDYESSRAWTVTVQFLSAVNAAFMTILPAWAGYRAADVFGGTPVLGGMVGMFTNLDQINTISQTIGWYNEAQPLNAILRSGRGGVLAVLIGVYFMCRLERAVRKRMPDSLETVLTPLITLLLTLIPYLMIVMPAIGAVSMGICSLVEKIAMSPHALVRMAAGYIGAALFLPMVAAGMHHGLIALYTVQLETIGYVTLYPALAMAGAGQVGAAAALLFMLGKKGNPRLRRSIAGAIPAGILGVGEPLIYGVMLPLGRPLIPACLGAGAGGAFVMLMEVASTTWGPSGLPGVFVMTEGPHGAALSMGCYLAGLAISAAAAFLLTRLMIRREDLPSS